MDASGDHRPLLEPPFAGSEIDSMLGGIERQRRTFAWKCSGVDAEGMRTRIGASTLTLGRLVAHMAMVEDDISAWRLWGEDPFTHWPGAQGSFDWAWDAADDRDPEELLASWRAAVERSRDRVARAIAAGGLDQPAVGMTLDDGSHPSLRRLLVDLLEEQARHTGHADLLREAVDGRVGEDAPEDLVL